MRKAGSCRAAPWVAFHYYAPHRIRPSTYMLEDKKCRDLELKKPSTSLMKQAKQAGHHPKSLGPVPGEGDAIRSPPGPSGELECLKEISRDLEDTSVQLLV